MQLLSRLAVEHAQDAVQTHRRDARQRGVNGNVTHASRIALVRAVQPQHAQVHAAHTARRVARVQHRVIVRHAAARKGTVSNLCSSPTVTTPTDGLHGTALRPRVVEADLVVARHDRQFGRRAIGREELLVKGGLCDYLHVGDPDGNAQVQEVVGDIAATENGVLLLDVVQSNVVFLSSHSKHYGKRIA